MIHYFMKILFCSCGSSNMKIGKIIQIVFQSEFCFFCKIKKTKRKIKKYKKCILTWIFIKDAKKVQYLIIFMINYLFDNV
jgi:hypothetical protein